MFIPAEFDAGDFFGEGLAPVRVDKKMGYIDCSGHWVLTPRFVWAQACHDGWCRASEKKNLDEFALFDREGHRLNLEGLSPYQPYEGMIVGLGSSLQLSFGFADIAGKTVVAPRYPYAQTEFSEGLLAACEAEHQCGYVDRGGTWIVQPTYCYTGSFNEGLGRVGASNGEVYYIDHDGKRAFETSLRSGWEFRDGIAAASADGKRWGIIDRSGRFIVAPTFDFIGLHRDGRALFMRKTRWGVIDYAGKIVLDALFDNAELRPGGIADVRLGNEHGYYDRDGHGIENIPSLEAYRDIKRITLIAVSGHETCSSFRLDVFVEGNATFTADCDAHGRRSSETIDPMRDPGRFESNNATDLFSVLAKFAADEDLAHYDDRRTGGAFDSEYDHFEIETKSSVRSLEVAMGIAPSLQVMDWSLKQAVRELKWERVAKYAAARRVRLPWR